MYKVLCPECNHYNYSASKTGKWVCCHCGAELEKKEASEEVHSKKYDYKNREKLA